jgi:hypothetical protein
VQENAVKMVAGLKGKDYLEKCAELDLQTLEARRRDQDMALVHKFLTDGSNFSLFIKTAEQDRARTRQAAGDHGLTVQYARTDPRKYSFAVRTVDGWNKPPDDTRSAPNGKVFRRKLRKITSDMNGDLW